MSDFDNDDEPYIPPQKHASKSTENDKAALLSHVNAREEYTDIFDEGGGSGGVVKTVDFEEGESVSASDDEVAGYTGDLENYTESELDPPPNISSSILRIPEATLINFNDNVPQETVITENGEGNDGKVGNTDHLRQPLQTPAVAIVTNETISEIAVKLKEVAVTPDNIVKPGKPVKVTEEISEKKNSVSELYSEENAEGDVSSGDTSRSNNLYPQDRRKKYRKRTTSHASMDNEEVLSSSGEIPREHEQSNGHSYTEHKQKSRKKKDKSKQEELNRSGQNTNNSNKLIDIETPPATPYKETSVVDTKTKKQNSRSINTKRKKTRHKIYLDDPDVHQLISDQLQILKKYAEDLKSGNYKTRQPALIAGRNNVQNHSMRGVGPNAYRQPHHYNQQQHIHPHHQQHPQHQAPQFRGVHTQGTIGIPHHGQNARGRDIVARIRKEDPSSSSSDEDCHTNNAIGRKHNQGYNQISTGDHGANDMYLCPDCGEYHHENDVADVQEICPDCGVAHNPYQHTPSQNNAFQKYTDACRNAIPKQRSEQYERVSTEQNDHQKSRIEIYQRLKKSNKDPEDVRQDTLPSIEGPHGEDDLMNGVRYKLKYLGSCQITTQHPVTKETRMQQAQDAFTRIKGQDDDDDDDVSTNVDMFISLERIKIINKDTKFEDVMMDHALRTVCFICDMGNVLVLMARRLTSDHATDFSIEQGKPISLGSIVGDREKKTSKNICHVFEGEYEASKIAKAIGQAFNIAYRQFLQSNGIAHEHVEEAEYCHVLESQKLVGQDLDKLTDQSSARDIVVAKRRGDPLGIMLLESGWGSMLPTVFIAHLQNYSAAARSQRLSVGDHILTCNGASLVGLPLSECNTVLRNTRSSERVIFRVVSCPPVVDVVVSRPDVKYQLGFSVQNGTICSLLRGGIAERGGVRVGHRIIEINGDSVVAKSHQYIVDILANTTGAISMKTMPIAMYRLMVGDDLPIYV